MTSILRPPQGGNGGLLTIAAIVRTGFADVMREIGFVDVVLSHEIRFHLP